MSCGQSSNSSREWKQRTIVSAIAAALTPGMTGVVYAEEQREADDTRLEEVIVSALQKASDWDVVQLMYLKEMRKKTVGLKGASQTLVLDPEGVDGAFVDWLLRQQNGYELVKDKDGKLEIRYLVPDAN